MSDVPSQLRDTVVRRLEVAVDDRDREIGRVRGETQHLRGMVQDLEGDVQTLQVLQQGFERDMTRLDADLAEERDRARAALDALEARMRKQHLLIGAALADAERRHQQDRAALRSQIRDLARRREEQARRTRAMAARTADRAATALAGLEAGRAEAMDQGGRHRAVVHQMNEARAVVADGDAMPHDALAAATAVESAVRQLVGVVSMREATLAAEAARLEGRFVEMNALIDGAPVRDLPDQRKDVSHIMPSERALMQGVLQHEVHDRLEALQRWNGHAALVTYLDQLCDRLDGEIHAARRALPAAVDHEKGRYLLRHIWRDLELRFGAIRYQGAQTDYVKEDPAEPKSTYFHLLDTGRGEVRVRVPWDGDLEVFLGDRRMAVFAPIEDISDDARAVGGLGDRWNRLAQDIQLPDRRAWMGGEGELP